MNKNIYTLAGALVAVLAIFFGIQYAQDNSYSISITDTPQILSSLYHENILPLLNGEYASSAYTALVSNATTSKKTKTQKLFGANGTGVSKIDGTAVKNRVRRLKADPKVLRNADTVEINLFTDRTFVARKARAQKSGRAEIWAGKIEGQEGSEVTLVTQDNQITGSVRTKDGEFYTISPDIKTGESKIEEVSKTFKVFEESSIDYVPAPPEPVRSTTTNSTSFLISNFKKLVAQTLGSGGTEQTVIDLLVVYTAEARILAGGTSVLEARIQLAVAEMNQAYANSKIDMTMRLVAMVEAAPSANQAVNLAYLQEIGSNITIQNLRNQYNADLVAALVVGNAQANIGTGLGYMPVSPEGSANAAFSVSESQFIAGPYYVLSHEIGHNLGAAHDRDSAGSPGVFPYSYGYKNPLAAADFKDIMSYGYGCYCPRINGFSNPNVLFKGFPTGISESQPNSADLASTFQKMKVIVSRYRGSSQPTSIINFFQANPSTVSPGSAVTLTWSTNGDVSLNISGGVGQVTGLSSKTVYPTTTTTYVLTAIRGGVTETASVTVTVNGSTPPPVVTPAPTISTFTASPGTITAGGSTTLSWSVADATSLSISGVGAVTGTSRTVSPTTTTTYTLTATNATGSRTASVTVTVNPVVVTPPPVVSKPMITSFTASPSSITSGGYSTLSWNVSGATSVSVSNIGFVLAVGQVSISPQSTTSYILTATNSAGTVTSTVTVSVSTSVNPVTAPNVQYPNSGNLNLVTNQPAVITPDNYGGAVTSCYAEQTLPAGLSLSNTCVISGTPTMSQSSVKYSVLAYNNLGGRRVWVNIAVSGSSTPPPVVTPAPTISTFTASPGTITAGGSTTLSWSVADATSLSISGVGAVTGTSRTVSPTTTTTYTLTATNATGSRTASVTVTVNPVVVTPPPVSGAGITITYPTNGTTVSGVLYATAKVTGFTPSLDFIYLSIGNRNPVKAYGNGGGVYSGGISLGSLTPGPYALNFSSTDITGKTYTATVNINVQ